ncbi:hypothetical protein Ancab_003642 [Ancistrocladus abbreviatus]
MNLSLPSALELHITIAKQVVVFGFSPWQVTELPFFASRVRIGRNGAEEIFPLGSLTEYERVGLEKAEKELTASIQ